jgi:putative restriction endonuclease
MYTAGQQIAIREDVFRWLDAKISGGAYELTRTELEGYSYAGTRIPLIDTGRGIRNPRDFDASLTILTSVRDPYKDATSRDGFVRYRYQSRSGGDNLKLRRAYEERVPLVYFQGVRPGVYVAFYPVFVIADDAEHKAFVVSLDDGLNFFADPLNLTIDERRYADRLVRQRLHQPAFRARIMHAYERSCAVCRLKHPELLDAAHIIEDLEVDGLANVNNGLALCKIHHAAYDRDLLGITPDYEVQINRGLLDEIDGPMLRHGLQEMHGTTLTVPRRARDRPSRDGLAARWENFVA